jgi:O-antigen/teichoic acid export membrane protein
VVIGEPANVDGPAPAPAAPEPATPAAGRGLRRLAGRAGWNLADQVLSALTNVALTFVVARTVDDEDRFGAFSTALLIFYLLIGVERALVGQVMGIRHSDVPADRMRRIAADGLGTIATLGVVGGALTAMVGWFVGGLVGPPLIAVGVVMPGLLLQDTCRMIFFAQAMPKLAAVNDALWAVVQFSVIGLLIAAGLANPWSLVLAWGGAALLCVGLALLQLRVLPRPGASAAWCREHRDLVGYLLPETLLTSGGLQATTLVTGKIVGVRGVGSFGGAQRLLGPLGMVSAAVMTFAMPEISRRKTLSSRTRWRFAVALSVLMTLASLLYVAALLLLPDSVGHMLFKASWTGIRSVLLPMGLFSTVASACLGPALVIIAMGHARRTFWLTVLEAPLVLTMMPVGAVLGGAPGAAWGQFVAQAIQLPFWFWQLHRVLRLPAAADRVGGAGLA